MSPEEERWITVILEEARKAENAERQLRPAARTSPKPPSRRPGHAVRVGSKYFVERSGQQGAPVI